MRANGSVHALPSKELVKEINALKAQLKKVSAAMETDAHDGVNRAVGAIETKSKEAIDSAIESAQDFIEGYAESVKDAASAIARKSTEMRDNAAESLVETVQNRPFGTLAAVIGIGFLAGYLCRRSN